MVTIGVYQGFLKLGGRVGAGIKKIKAGTKL